jgi:peptidoglycan/LPS O-acetylase OafA/YrhL
MKRIYSIDFFKLLFAYLIAFSHFDIYLPGADCAVVFFFIISGYFLGKKFYKKRASSDLSYSGVRYTVDHIKTLYPHYIFSLLMMVFYYLAKNVYSMVVNPDHAPSVMQLLKRMYALIPEVFLIQNIGFFDGGMNYPLWQVCVLLICGYFIYSLLYWNEKLSTHIIFPLAIIFIQTYLKNGVDPFGIEGIFYIPLLRAFSAISFGVLICKLLESSSYKENSKSYKNIINLCSVPALISMFVESYSNIFWIAAFFIIAALTEPSSWLNRLFNRGIFKSFGSFSYAIYLNHALAIWFIKDFQPEIFAMLRISETKWSSALFLFLILTVYSLITTVIVNFLKKKCTKKIG